MPHLAQLHWTSRTEWQHTRLKYQGNHNGYKNSINTQ